MALNYFSKMEAKKKNKQQPCNFLTRYVKKSNVLIDSLFFSVLKLFQKYSRASSMTSFITNNIKILSLKSKKLL